MDPDDRTFVRELLRRHEKATDAMIADMRAHTADMRAHTAKILRRFDEGTDALRRHTERMDENHRQNIEEFKAQRQALFRILDRLDGGAAGA